MMNRLIPPRFKKKSSLNDELIETTTRATYTFQPRNAPNEGNSRPSLRSERDTRKVKTKEHTSIPSNSRRVEPTKKSAITSEKRSDVSSNGIRPSATDPHHHSNNVPIEKFHDVEDQPTLETSSTKLTDTSNSQSPNNGEELASLGVSNEEPTKIQLEEQTVPPTFDIDVENAADQPAETVSSTIPKAEEQQRRISLLLDDMSTDAPDHAFLSASSNSFGNDRQADEREFKPIKPRLIYDEILGEHSINEIAFKNYNENGDGLSDDDITLTSLDIANADNEIFNKKSENSNHEQNKKDDTSKGNKNNDTNVLDQNQTNGYDLSNSKPTSQAEKFLSDNHDSDSDRIDDVITVSESSESDTDWESVDSSSGSEGDGLKRGMKKKKAAHRHRKEYLTQNSGDSSDDDDIDTDFFKYHKKDELDVSERSMDMKDLVMPPKTPEKVKKKKPSVIDEVVPLPPALSPRKQVNQDSIPDQDVFAALVEQLDASMNELMSEGDKELGKPGPAKSPGNTAHERLFRQNFAGATLNKNSNGEQIGTANVSDGSDNNSEPDFFDDDDDSMFNSNTNKNQESSASDDVMAMLNAELTPSASSVGKANGAGTQNENAGPASGQAFVSPSNGRRTFLSPKKSITNPVENSDQLKGESQSPNANDVASSEATKKPDYPPLSNSLSLLDSVSDNLDESTSSAEDFMDISSKSKPKKQKKKTDRDTITFKKMQQLIDLDPWDEDISFDENKFLKLIDQHTKCCERKYELEAFEAEVFPLSAICAFDASLQCVKKCFKAAPASVENNDESLGTPLHYACSFNASIDVVKFLVKKYPEALQETDEFKRTPLHVAALFQADVEVVSYLLKEYPSAASEADEECMTPLHLAIEAEDGVNIDVVNKLIKANPAACTSRSLTDNVTPLMLAVARKCPQSVLKEIIKGNGEALKIPDKEGRIPLHVAAALKADASTINSLIKAFPAGVKIKDNAGDTAWHLAKKVKLKKEILAMLKP